VPAISLSTVLCPCIFHPSFREVF